MLSDEAHFWLNGYVNKQNCRIWDEEQPEEVKELPLHPDKTTVAKPATIEELEAIIITHVIGQIPVEMLDQVIKNWNFRIDHFSRSTANI